jgi:ABC-type transport system substrate-binding protein
VKRNLFVLLSLLVIASVLTACGGAPATATEAPPVVTEPPATEAPATEEPTEAPATEAPATEAPSTFDGMSVAAPDCDYGGKISSIEATDQLTVVFNLCKPDPAFLAKVAFTPFGIQPSE